MPQSDHVAIVGLGCLFPAAPDLSTYWRNVVEARDGITEVPPDHSWSPDDLYDADPQAADKSWCTRGGFLDAVPFDPMAFGIPPTMLESIDTTQLLSLLVARETLRDAGLDPDDPAWSRDRVSVILGVTGTQELAVTAGARLQGPVWRKALLRCGVDPELADLVVKDIANHFPAWTEQTFPGLLGNVVAGRIANRLDLGGTNAVVDAACASSLAAVQYAMSDLLAGRSDLALTGGADTMNDAFMFQCFTRTPAFSRKGDARPFDAEADGILIGEGIALLALKRLSDAERDGNRIYAVIRGVGSSSDGRHRSIYAPNPDGQEKALRRTYAMAGVTPDTVELVEAHGTGTRAGDAAEIDALTRVYGDAGRTGRWAALGSVKALVGHTKSTAGAAGLVKAALALHHRVLPPAAKIERPNPKMNFDRSPFYLSPRARPWFGTAAHPRRAAVSAFGFGGLNFHAVLEEHGAADRPGFGAPVAELFLVGAETEDVLARQLRALGGPTVAHAARAALAEWQPGRAHVAAFLAGSLDELADRVAIVEGRWAGAAPRPGEPVWTGGGPAPKVAFLFPGQGSQYLEMGRTLALRHPSVRRAFERADEVLGFPLTAKVFPPPAWTDAERKQHEHELQATEIAQPAIGALSLGMANLLARFGVVPMAAAGHSYGELVALCVAGTFDEDTLLHASAVRGQLMSASERDRGGMAAIDGPLEIVERLVDGVPDVVVANRNHPAQAVVSGPAAALAVLLRRAADAGFTGRELRVAAAFHSPLVADAEQPFREALGALPVGRPTFPVIAGALAAHYPDDPDGIRDLLARSLVLPVDWVGTVQALVTGGAELLLEVGPRGVLAGLAERCVPDVPVLALDRQADRADGDVQLKATLAALAAAGVPVDPTPLIEQRLPSAPRSASGAATVWLAGANYRKPETRMPPKPVLPPRVVPASSPGDGWGAIPSSGSPMDRPVHLERDVPAPPPAAVPAPAASGDLLALLESTRATLAAFQDAQAKTADVHARFLDAVHHANDNFARLFEAQTRLVERVAAGGVLPVHTPVAEVRAPAPPPPEPVRAPARPLPASVALASPDRPAVATDLPPLLDARAAVEARSAPQPTVNEPAILGPGRTPPRHETLVAALLDAVARKTGYPREALELSMDLEADLGVDSIKRVEILSAVREILPELPEIDAEALGGLRTLADVAGHLAGVAAGLGFALIGSEAVGRRQPDLLVPEPAPPQAQVPEPAPPPVLSARDLDPSPPVFLRRSSICLVPAPEGVSVPPGGRWLVAPDTQGRAARVVNALVARGVDAVVGDPGDGPWAGVVHLSAIGLSGDGLRDAVRGAFQLARAVGPVGFFATVSGRGGRFGRAPAIGEPLEGALAGLPRTLAREWPGCRALALDIDPDLDADHIADELLRDRGTVDVGRTADEVFTLAAVSDAPETSALDLRPGDLVVVTGGARGVTAACALALVHTVPVSLLLLGRTELADEPAWARGVPDGDLLGAAVKAARAAGEALAPRDADRRAAGVRGAREIRATVRAAERGGAPCTYRSVDVRDRDAVAALVADAVAAHGPVRLVVHGAGVLADRKVVDKTPAQFDEVFSTKVDGLEAVLAACDFAELRSVVAFTSIAGRRGNAGQVDYAMANEAVVQRLLGLPCHVRAIDWGPWAGGMVTPALAAHFASQGLRPIPLAEGAATFVAELGRSGEVEVVVEAPRTASGTEERVLSARVPFLRDHRIGGRPVLPAAMVLEWMAELSAEVAPGRHVAAIERFEVLKGITLDAPERAVTVVWEQASPDALEIEVRSPAVSMGHPVRHYRASVRLSSTPPPRPQWPGPNGLASEVYPYAIGEAYDRFLFHGPTLHGIDEIVGWSDHGIVAWLRTSEPRGLGVASARWETDPLVVDAALQLMCLWVREKLGSAALPSGFGLWRQVAPFSGKRVAAHLSMDAGATTRGGRFDVVFVDEAGAVVAELGRATYTGEPSLVPQFRSGG